MKTKRFFTYKADIAILRKMIKMAENSVYVGGKTTRFWYRNYYKVLNVY